MPAFVPYTARDGYQLNNVPGPQLRRLRKRAARDQASVSNVVAALLAERYGIPYEPSRRPTTKNESTREDLSLRLPVEVMDAVRYEADTHYLTIRSVILNALSDALKLKRPAETHLAGKRPGRKKEK